MATDQPPLSVEALAEQVRNAAADSLAIVPRGAGTRMHLGTPTLLPAYDIDMAGLNRVLEYTPSDLTVTVEAGITLGALQAELARHGQWLPWDPPQAAEATIGGLLATAASGPLRLGYGTPRDWTLGMRAVLGDGRIVKSGGKVVKNVAGYDLHKLHIGAFGTLGIIAETTFKVFPLPETSVTLQLNVPDRVSALALAEQLRQPPLAPVSLIITNVDSQTAAPAFSLTVRYAGIATAVKRQLQGALAVATRLAEQTTQLDDAQASAHWQHLADFSAPQGERIILRAGVRPSLLDNLLAALQSYAPPSSRASVVGYPGVGLAYAHWADGSDFVERLETLRAAIVPQGGYVVVEQLPAGWGSDVDRWGPAPATLPLMQQLKHQWDPQGILNPGRYLPGL